MQSRADRHTVHALAGALLVGLSFAGHASAQTTDGVPTWYADVLPIVAQNCIDCHQPQGINMGGMVAPFSMMSYDDARPWAPMMAKMVSEHRMPPWFAHPVHKGTFEDERYLSDDQIGTIVAWANGGAPAGDPSRMSDEVAAKLQTEESRGEWAIGDPDLIMTFAEPFYVDDNLTDLNVDVNVVVPDDYTEPHWIKASELRAGSPYVHHVCGEPFGCIAQGWDSYVYPDGFAQLMPPVQEVQLGMHYNKKPGPGTGFYDRTQAALVFYKDGDVIEHFVHRSVLAVPPGDGFLIPAGDPDVELQRDFTFDEDTYILSLTPHMHYRGKEAKYELEYPDGTKKLLLYVPHYHFEWQRTYRFRDPPIAPKGSTLHWIATFDNSAENPYNPDPTVDVTYGLPTYMEMANGWLDYTPVEPMHLVVGRDPVPADLLAEVTKQIEAVGKPGIRVEDGQRLAPPDTGAPPPSTEDTQN
jgi:mono/diheme cytochrome c family protein